MNRIFSFVALVLSACWIGPGNWDDWDLEHGKFDTDAGEGDTDTDTDADTDTDSDADGDTDADSDSDSDSDADSDADTDIDPLDRDDDGDGFTENEGDCDDTDRTINPDATESWYDGVDQDCDGESDYDQDGDGYDSDGYGGTDCNDGNPWISPAASETWYNGVDEDCSGGSDYDRDGDGYDSDSYGGTDCADLDGAINPGASEVWYDGVDQDCSGGSDYDRDGDGYDSDAHSGMDCDDTQALVNPSATEVCNNGVDDDCDGTAGSCRLSGTASISTADAEYQEETGGGYAGWALAFGDSDADGVDEMMVGDFFYSATGTNREGATYLINGPTTGVSSLGSASAKLVGDGTYDQAGQAVAFGDLDGDGDDDLIIGARDQATYYPGRVYTLLSPVTGTVSLSSADGDIAGYSNIYAASVLAVDDFNADGLDDIAINAPGAGSGYSGVVYLVYGPATGTGSMSYADVTLSGEAADDQAPTRMTTGDVDGDGVADLVLGVDNQDSAATNAGAAYIVLGPITANLGLGSADVKLDGVLANEEAGTDVALGDVNGDGACDILVGAHSDWSSGSMTGAAYAVHGPLTASASLATATTKLLGESYGDRAGHSVSLADLDGDGFDDFVVGSDLEDAAAGAVYVVFSPISGTTSLNSADAKLYCNDASDYVGAFLATGDADGDGLDDLLVGTLGDGAYLIYGSGW